MGQSRILSLLGHILRCGKTLGRVLEARILGNIGRGRQRMTLTKQAYPYRIIWS